MARPAVPSPPPVPVDVLRSLAVAAARARKAEDQVDELVRSARAAGYSWDQISAAVGRNRETLRRTFREPA